MELNKRLNLVIEVERADGITVFVHHTPIDRTIYEANYFVLLQTLTSMYSAGLREGAVMRVGMLHLMKTAEDMGILPTVEKKLLPEFWRLTNVVMPGERGWTTLPFEIAIKDFDDDDISEVKNMICFFTAASWVHPKKERIALYEILKRSGLQIVSLNSTDFASSLTTSTVAENTGAKQPDQPDQSSFPV